MVRKGVVPYLDETDHGGAGAPMHGCAKSVAPHHTFGQAVWSNALQETITADRARELYCCDEETCSYAYCPACILRHYGTEKLDHIHSLEEGEPWLCFKCEHQLDLSGSPASVRSVEY